jgi:hypothetical protein
MKTYIAIESDTHAFHKLGLCNPEVEISEEDEFGNLQKSTPKLTKVQEHLWDLRSINLAKLTRISNGEPIVYVHNGDLTHGNKHPEQLMGSRLSDQILVAHKNLEPIAETENVKAIRLIAGTGSHVFGEGSSEILVSELLKKQFPDKDIATVAHWNPTIAGIKCNFSHHGPGQSSRIWLEGNSALQYLRDTIFKELWDGQEPSRLNVFSHYHTPVYKSLERNGQRHMIVVTPSMCGLSDYGRQATKSTWQITWGMTVFEISDGEISEPIQLYETLDIRTKEGN